MPEAQRPTLVIQMNGHTPGPATEPSTSIPRSLSFSKRLFVLGSLIVIALAVRLAASSYFPRAAGGPVKSGAAAEVSEKEKLFAAGVSMAESGRWLEAVELFESARQNGMDTAELSRDIGRCLSELGWMDDAIVEYEKSIKQDPAYFNAYINLATVYRSIGRRSEAIELLRQAERVLDSPDLLAAPERYSRPAARMLEELAEAYARVGEFDRSVEWALRAQTADPTRTRGYMLGAKSYFVLGQPDKAIPTLQKACTIAPNDPDAHYSLALALRARPSLPHTASAREHLIQTIKLDAYHAPALYQLGVICIERKEWDFALQAFRRAYEQRYEPGSLLWFAAKASGAKGDMAEKEYFLGQYYEYVGQLTTALTHYRTLLGNPLYRKRALDSLARTQAKSGLYDKAVETIGIAIARDPKSAELRRQLAAVFDKQHLVTKRMKALEQAARLDPASSHKDYYQLGRIALDVGNYDEAERLLNRAIAVAPQESQYHYSMGQVLLLRPELGDRLTRAIAHLEESQRLAPDSAMTHDFLSSAYMKAEQWQKAAVALHRAVNLEPQNQVTYFRLNQLYKRLGNTKEATRARTYYERLRKQEVERDTLVRKLKAKPDDPETRLAMGDFQLKARDYASAKRQFETLIQLRPADPRGHERLVTVYGELALPEGQLQRLRSFRKLSLRNSRVARKQ